MCDFIYVYITYYGLGSVVGIATAYWLDAPGIESRLGRGFPHLSRPALYKGYVAYERVKPTYIFYIPMKLVSET